MSKAPEKPITSKRYMTNLSLIHTALVLAILIFGAITYANGGELITGFIPGADMFIYLAPLLAMIAYFGGEFLFRRILSSIHSGSSLKQKLNKYSQASLIRFVLLEGASFIGIYAYMHNNNILYLVITVVLILYLIKLKPTKAKLIQQLRLNQHEQKRFNMAENEL